MTASRGRGARNKGAEFERMISRELNAAGYHTRRGQVFNGEPDIVGFPGWHLEVKNQDKLQMRKWWEQAEEDAAKREDGEPAVVFKWPRGKPMVMITLDAFLALIGGKDNER